MSGIVAGDDDGDGVTGIAPDAQIMPIHTFPRRTRMSNIQFWKLIAESIDYSVANGADVINMSLGGQSSGSSPAKNSRSTSRRSVHCVTPWTPQRRPAPLSLLPPATAETGATEKSPRPAMARSLSPPWRPRSTAPTGRRMTRPSTSLLLVKSVVGRLHCRGAFLDTACVRQRNVDVCPCRCRLGRTCHRAAPGWTPQQVQDQITSTTKDLGVNGRDPLYGWGLVDAAAAVGAAAPTPKKQNFFTTWYEPSWGGENNESVISWTTPAADSVTGYTVTVYTDATTSTYNVDGNTVRVDVLLPPGAWFTVTAHTSGGDVTSYPATATAEIAATVHRNWTTPRLNARATR